MLVNNKINLNDVEEKSYIDSVKEVQGEFSNIILPSMGLIDNEVIVPVDGKDYIEKTSDGGE